MYFFYRVIQNISEMRPKSKYILAVDDSKNTLEDIVKVIILPKYYAHSGK